MVDLTQAHKASIELLGTRHTALVEAVRNYVNGSVQPSIDELVAAIEDVTTDIDTKEKMLLGLASRQAKKPVPSLILDFKTRHYLQGTRRPEKGYRIHDLLTVDRATPKWVYSASGKLTEVPAHEPAYQHDPVTGEPQGLLIEESRTNLLLWSEDFTNPVWAKSGSSVVPTGDTFAGKPVSKIVEDDTDSTHILSQPSGVIGSVKTTTYLLKAGERRRVLLREYGVSPVWSIVDISSGAIINQHSDAATTVKSIGGGWCKVSFTREITAPTNGLYLLENDATSVGGRIYQGEAGSGVYILTAQAEQAPTPSSYIPTEDAQVTRAADDVSRDLGDEFNPREGTFYVDLSDLGGGVNNPSILSVDAGDGSLSPGAYVYLASSGSNFVFTIRDQSGAVAATHGSGSTATGKVALAFTQTEMRWAAGGVSGTVQATSPPSFTKGMFLRLGDHTSGSINLTHLVIEVLPSTLTPLPNKNYWN